MKRGAGRSLPWHRKVTGWRGLGRRREGGGGDHLSSTGRSSRCGNKEMIVDLEVGEEVGALGRLL
jgi:hypothetical protein